MRVLLLKDIPTIGKQGTIASVRPGYARNFLFPKHLAEPATPATQAQATRKATQEESKRQKANAALSDLVLKLTGSSVTVVSRANRRGNLYGSVTEHMVRDALYDAGFSLPVEATIELPKPIDTLGKHDIILVLSSEHRVHCTVEVKPS